MHEMYEATYPQMCPQKSILEVSVLFLFIFSLKDAYQILKPYLAPGRFEQLFGPRLRDVLYHWFLAGGLAFDRILKKMK